MKKIELFKRKKVFKKGGSSVNPDLYWDTVLVVAFFLIVFYFIAGFTLFKKVNAKIVIPDGGADAANRVAPREKIDEVLGFFQDRANRSFVILNSPSPIIDPSQ